MSTSILNKTPLLPKPRDEATLDSVSSRKAAHLTNATNTAADAPASRTKAAHPWLSAWHDPLANVHAYTSCIRLVDLNADGDYKLLIADTDKKLKVYKGQHLFSEHALLDTVQALAVFYSDLKTPQTPSIAVAAGSYIFIYRNLRPYYKFTLPNIDIDENEQRVWQQLKEGKLGSEEATSELQQLHGSGVLLSSRSMIYLTLSTEQQCNDFIEQHRSLPLIQGTVVTCMDVIQKSQQQERAVSMLVIGSENKMIYIMDSTGTHILTKFQLPSVPVTIAIDGLYDIDYRLCIACRNGHIYTIKNGKLLSTVIELDAHCITNGLCIIERSIVVGCTNSTIHSYTLKGKKNYTIYLPGDERLIAMTQMDLRRANQIRALLVATSTGSVHVYVNKYKITTINSQNNDLVHGMRFGPYGREDACLVLVYASGTLSIKMLQRSASFDVSQHQQSQIPAEQDIPLNIPKKTKLYLEQTQRERDQSIEMHRIFQRDLVKLRLNTARTYVDVITGGTGPLSTSAATPIRLDATISGLGPYFKLHVNLQNTGNKLLYDISLVCHYNANIYKLPNSASQLPMMIPGVEYTVEFKVMCSDENGAADAVRIFVCQPGKSIPSFAAVVNMPQSELEVE